MVRRKAVADVMLLIGMMFGIVLIFFDFTPFWYEGDTYKVLLHTHMYSMSNTLDAAELYVETSLDYSAYQALYDILGSGGFETVESGREGIAYWSDSSSSIQIPTREQVTEAVRKRTEENLAKYTGAGYTFTYDYTASLPLYKVSIQDEPDGFSITTSSDDANISTSKYTQEYGMKEDIVIKRPFLPEALYDIDYGEMLKTGSGENPGIVSAFLDAFSQALQGLSSSTCSSRDECTHVFRTSLEAKPGVKTTKDRGGYTIETELLDAQVTAVDFASKTYEASALQKVTVRESTPPDDHFYPVWNGKEVSFEALELVFINRASS